MSAFMCTMVTGWPCEESGLKWASSLHVLLCFLSMERRNPFSLSTDHCVHYYDLRNTTQPITVFKGHRKAVSYTKFINTEEIVSA